MRFEDRLLLLNVQRFSLFFPLKTCNVFPSFRKKRNDSLPSSKQSKGMRRETCWNFYTASSPRDPLFRFVSFVTTYRGKRVIVPSSNRLIYRTIYICISMFVLYYVYIYNIFYIYFLFSTSRWTETMLGLSHVIRHVHGNLPFSSHRIIINPVVSL